MAFPTFFVLVTVCCFNMVAANAFLAHRQARQMYVVPPLQLGYSYYNPYGGQMFYPHQFTGWPYPSDVTGESVFTESQATERAPRDSIIIISAATECISDDVTTKGLSPCVKTSGAKRGSISIKLSKALQTAVVGIVRSSTSRITLRCSEMTAVAAFTKTGKINDKSVVRTETGVLQLVVSSTGDNAVMKCTW